MEPPKDWREKYKPPSHEEGLFDIPPTWTWASTLEVCDRVENGNTPPPSEMAHGNGEIPYIKVYNLTRKGFLDFSINPTYISRSTHEERLGRSKIFPGDVLMNIVGPPLGKVSIVPDYYPEWNTNQAVVVFRPWASLKSDYLACAFMCDNVLYWITRTAQATAGQFNISVSNCRKLPVPLPPEREQMLMVRDTERTAVNHRKN